MLHHVIDRRLSGKNKSIGNRERFLRRYREQIREVVKRAVSGRGIRDMEQGEDISLPRHDVSEPAFGHASGGRREMVHPGNEEFVRGDRIKRPRGGAGGGSGQGGAPDGNSKDDFVFRISREEFMQYFFDELALPHLVRTQLLADPPEWKYRRAGYLTEGTPTNLHVVRSMRTGLSRRIAMGSGPQRELQELELQLELAERDHGLPQLELAALKSQVQALKQRISRIPFLDPFDLRFRNRVKVPMPVAKAVMFCVMDVSGSMDEARKDIAKRFFILLYLFLTRHYEHTDVVFIRHHTQAAEVEEEEFFQSTESGGTVVSSALKLMHEIIDARYRGGEWNIYGAQASDGDNWPQDSTLCRQLLNDKLLPACRYFSYVQVAEENQNLWDEYCAVAAANQRFAMQKITSAADIYPVFRQLFKKEVSG